MIKQARTRRTPDQLISDLEARIVAIKARAERKKVTKDPALRHVKAAVKAIDAAAAETKDTAMRTALGEARATLMACLGLSGVVVPAGRGGAPRGRRAASGGTVGEAALLAHVRAHPGQRAEQISAALGTDSAALRPVMKRLIDAGKVGTTGNSRATVYAAE